ncbi:hypothetical protein [Azomonas macrocytogenes]|uniref:Phosphatidate cytidylyltransferase n=1 Tax=Azomonas macrocytogenes TaxID=69962 RepID=A0A839T6G1_AZOMA|nr:hypothetical protein [Azomonas macrocytogenes]MBB3104430.1 hypothetical protein [Azomonas macrocytogenes]
MKKAVSLVQPPAALLAEVAMQVGRPVLPELNALADQASARFGEAVIAVLFYGSCLRSGNPSEGLVDLYLIVDDYARAHPNLLLRWANICLPPNVYLLQAHTDDGKILQAKCALLTLEDFERGTACWFQSYLWGRFAQPSRLVRSKDAFVAQRIHAALARAVLTLLSRTIPCLPEYFTADTLWHRALSLSYGTELRPEAARRPTELLEYDRNYYHHLFLAALPMLDGVKRNADKIDGYRNLSANPDYLKSQREWKLRRTQGRLLNVLRLVKSVFTFDNGVDYVAWKLERHTGQVLEITPRLRRYPLIFCWPILWRLLKERHLR